MGAFLYVEIFFVVFATGLFIYSRLKKKTEENFKPLPGPVCVPFIGYLPFYFAKAPSKLFSDLAKIYGDAYQLKVGTRTVVVINSLPLLREVMNKWSFSGRPNFPSSRTFSMGDKFHRFSFMNLNPEWKFLRKNAIKALSLFATSKNSRLKIVVEEACKSLHKDFEDNLGQLFNPKQSISECVAGITGALNFGLQFNRKDPLLEKLHFISDHISSTFKVGNTLDYIPELEPFRQGEIKRQKEVLIPLNDAVENHIINHKCNEDIATLADALYKRSLEIPENNFKNLGIERIQIQNLAQDFFAAGYLTIVNSYIWCLYLLAKFQSVQEKVGQELRTYIGPGEFPSVSDSEKTPYTEAAILEMFRYSTMVPFAAPHSTTEVDKLGDYWVPEGAVVLPNVWYINNDPRLYKNPSEFDPERFLNPDGSLNTDLAQNIITFGLGKRRCVGESMAKQELYLLVASTFAKFTVQPAKDEFIDTENNVTEGLLRVLDPGKLIFRKRDHENSNDQF